jgi:hypothetical protein
MILAPFLAEGLPREKEELIMKFLISKKEFLMELSHKYRGS